MKIVFASTDPQPHAWVELIRRALPDAEVCIWAAHAVTNVKVNPGASADADYAVVWQPPAALFASAPRLKAVFNLGAGVDGLLRVPGLPPNVPLIRLEDAGMAAQMAEYVLHHVVEITRDMARYRAQQAQGVWQMLAPIARATWPVGVLGLGQMGQRVARALAALDYAVAGWARSHHAIDGVEVFAGPQQLSSFLGRTRIVVNTLPLTDATRDLLDYQALTRLQAGAVVINVGRGEHLVDDDLVRAIGAGHVTRAVLDVFRQEPLPHAHPFWRMPEITLTPHVAARTLRDATIAQIADKIRVLEAGGTVTGVVDPARGY